MCHERSSGAATQSNIVGPSLAGRNIEDSKVSEFKHWLSIVRATTNGKKLNDFSK